MLLSDGVGGFIEAGMRDRVDIGNVHMRVYSVCVVFCCFVLHCTMHAMRTGSFHQ